ncbi:hypothetical protein K1T71_011027 [Dendrolimus kikuchii]|uniref:Uncharacterized protein n=1 Tax=Dendrolimus kikuchii TaxID=765133 RepID=A0ACC1CN29_9NEOP|nr:hypothetical protein K1T71_011027 [Dendrolimus kikuchii]
MYVLSVLVRALFECECCVYVRYKLCVCVCVYVLSGHGCFGRYLCQIRREQTAGCHHCSAGAEDTALHTLQECSAWDEQRRALGAIIGFDLSLPAVIAAMAGSSTSWDAVASFCEAVMPAKEAAERERERESALLSRRNNRRGRRGMAVPALRPP